MKLTEIISKCTEGDRKAQRALFDRAAPKVMAVCRRHGSNKEEVSDLFQECFYQIIKSLEKYDNSKGEFEGWVFQVSYHTILNVKRKAVRFFELNTAVLEVDKEEVYESPYEKGEVLHHIQALPEGYRLVLNMYVFDGFTHEEIANELGIAVSTSRSQLARARALLKKSLTKKSSKKYVSGSI